jgi:hypothetical protein
LVKIEKTLTTVKQTLQISLEDGLWLDIGAARNLGEALSGDYCFADPFPHIVIDGFLPEEVANKILENFPLEPKQNDVHFKGKVFEHNKRQIQPHDCTHFAREVFAFLNSEPILQFLEALTTIQGLIPDPYFTGGGFHEISNGGKLGIHADFRIFDKLFLQRRLNMLIYLNKDWQTNFGGELELWDKGMKAKVTSIAPVFNRCVIFSTDATSYHGHPDPLNTPENRTRKSMALYYYTASKQILDEVPAESTAFQARPTDNPKLKAKMQWRKIRKQLHQYIGLSEWMPPILYKYFKKTKKSLKSKLNSRS